MKTLSVVILTRDEEANLPTCLESLRGLDAQVFVVDSGSTDRTRDIALQAGCVVVDHPFENYARQLNWALDNLPFSSPWVMRLDADERLTPELAQELLALLPTLPEGVGGLMLKRRVYFWGRFIRHGGYYPTWLLRLWRRGLAKSEDRWMDEHMVLSGGEIRSLKHDIIDENHKGLGFWTDKHNRYADREVLDLLALEAAAEAEDAPAGQAGVRRWVKTRVYAKSPLFLRAFLYWLYRYTLRLGFLDGAPGLVFHFLQGFWYRFLVDAKLYEARRKAQAGGRRDGERREGQDHAS